MEFQLDTWLELFTHRLLDTFPGRVIFLGIQGSRGRGESKPDSDIDMVVVLDQVGLEDLRAYRELLRTLPHGGLTCGFFCGREELLHWPRYDLLQLVLDTKPLYGGLENFPPPIRRRRYTLGRPICTTPPATATSTRTTRPGVWPLWPSPPFSCCGWTTTAAPAATPPPWPSSSASTLRPGWMTRTATPATRR